MTQELQTRNLRIAVLWSGLSGYLSSCLRAVQQNGASLLVSHSVAHANAPYDPEILAGIEKRIEWTGSPDPDSLWRALREFEPEALIFASWDNPVYRRIARSYKGRIPRIMCTDNQWRGTPKQWLGAVTSGVFVRPLCDALWIPGERQVSFAKRLGFGERQLLRGMYCCDSPKFEKSGQARINSAAPMPSAFAYVGRVVPEKGIDTLLNAYKRYRCCATHPWPLIISGAGPLAAKLPNTPGIKLLGFTQPSSLPSVFCEASCLILPSKFEPWGVVVHEAAASGLAVIASNKAGSTAHLVQDGYNGYLFDPLDPTHLAMLMLRYSGMHENERRNMAANSVSLARQFSPDRWAAYLLKRIRYHQALLKGQEDESVSTEETALTFV